MVGTKIRGQRRVLPEAQNQCRRAAAELTSRKGPIKYCNLRGFAPWREILSPQHSRRAAAHARHHFRHLAHFLHHRLHLEKFVQHRVQFRHVSPSRSSAFSSTILRVKDDYDGAEPCDNSVATLAWLKLGAITGRKDFTEAAGKTLRRFARRL